MDETALLYDWLQQINSDEQTTMLKIGKEVDDNDKMSNGQINSSKSEYVRAP